VFHDPLFEFCVHCTSMKLQAELQGVDHILDRWHGRRGSERMVWDEGMDFWVLRGR
jgi:hypothetical protein